MGEEKKIKEKRFFKKVRGFKRFLLFTGIYILSFVILVGISAEYTSRPSFCPTCHYMETFHQSWKVSAHNKVECVECHFEPGMAGTIKGKLNGLVQIVNYVSLAYKKGNHGRRYQIIPVQDQAVTTWMQCAIHFMSFTALSFHTGNT